MYAHCVREALNARSRSRPLGKAPASAGRQSLIRKKSEFIIKTALLRGKTALFRPYGFTVPLWYPYGTSYGTENGHFGTNMSLHFLFLESL